MHTMILTCPQIVEDAATMQGKFLQLRLVGRDYIVCATATECRYHNQLLARFLSEQGIPHHWEGEENWSRIIPSLKWPGAVASVSI